MYIESSEERALQEYSFYRSTEHQNKVFFCASSNGNLCCYDMDTMGIHIVNRWYKDIKHYVEPVEWIFSDDNYIVFITGDGREAVRYHLKKREYTICNIELNCIEFGNCAYVEYEAGKLFIFSSRKNILRMVEIEEMKMDTVEYCDSEMNFYCGVRINNKIWLAQRHGDILLEFDVKLLKSRKHKLYRKLEEVNQIIDGGDRKLYILLACGDIYKFSVDEEELYSVIQNIDYGRMGDLVITNNQYIELPSGGQDILLIDKDRLIISCYKSYPEDFRYYNDNDCRSKYIRCYKVGNDMYYAMRLSNYTLKINTISGELSWEKLNIPMKIDFGKESDGCADNLSCSITLKQFINSIIDK